MDVRVERDCDQIWSLPFHIIHLAHRLCGTFGICHSRFGFSCSAEETTHGSIKVTGKISGENHPFVEHYKFVKHFLVAYMWLICYNHFVAMKKGIVNKRTVIPF